MKMDLNTLEDFSEANNWILRRSTEDSNWILRYMFNFKKK